MESTNIIKTRNFLFILDNTKRKNIDSSLRQNYNIFLYLYQFIQILSYSFHFHNSFNNHFIAKTLALINKEKYNAFP